MLFFFFLLVSFQSTHGQVTSQILSQKSSWLFHQILLLASHQAYFINVKISSRSAAFFIFSWMSRDESNLGSRSVPFLRLSRCSCGLQLLWVKSLRPKSIAYISARPYNLGRAPDTQLAAAEHWGHFVISEVLLWCSGVPVGTPRSRVRSSTAALAGAAPVQGVPCSMVLLPLELFPLLCGFKETKASWFLHLQNS